MANITTDTPRDASGKRTAREYSEAQILDVVVRRVRRESLRAISAATGVPRSTAAELLRRPEVVAMVESEQAAAGAVEADRDAAVGRERQRDSSRRSSASARTRAARAELAADKAESLGRDPVPAAKGKKRAHEESGLGRILGVSVAYQDGSFSSAGYDRENGSRNLEGETEDAWIARRSAERERAPYPASIRVSCEDADETGFGVDLNDPEDLAHRVGQLKAAGFGSRQAIEAHLRTTPPDGTCIMRFEQPPPTLDEIYLRRDSVPL